MSDFHRTEDPAVSDLQNAVLEMLEEAGIDTVTNDHIIALIAAAEKQQYLASNQEKNRFEFANPRKALAEVGRLLDSALETDRYSQVAKSTEASWDPDDQALSELYMIVDYITEDWEPQPEHAEDPIINAFMTAVGTLTVHGRSLPDYVLEIRARFLPIFEETQTSAVTP